jgi:two-component system, OmpR family, response regulator VicR
MPRPVLLIDGDHDCHQIVRTLLERDGVPFLGAFEPDAGLQLARSEQPALIICEVFVPARSRERLPDQLRSAADLRSVPLLVWTAQAFEEERQRVEALGANWLPKPARPLDLRELMLRLLA